MTEPTGPAIDQLTAERDVWRARALAMLEVLNEVEYFVDTGMVQAIVSKYDAVVQVRGAQLHDLIAAFETWRKFTEGGIAIHWIVPGEEQPGFELDENDVPF